MKSFDSIQAAPDNNVALSAAKSHCGSHRNTVQPVNALGQKRIFHNPVIGDRAILVKSGAETGGEYTLFQIEVVPGGGNTLHLHQTYSETFKVLEGELTVQLGGKLHVLYKGDSITIPQNTSHCFTNKSHQKTKFAVEFRPAQPGFEKAIAIAYGLAADGMVNNKSIPRKFSHMAILVALSGTVPSGIARFFFPLFTWASKRFHKTEQKLINKYLLTYFFKPDKNIIPCLKRFLK